MPADQLGQVHVNDRIDRAGAGTRRFDRARVLRSVSFSLIVNALCPYLLFRYLEPRFPKESILPLLYATTFPIFGFIFGVVRKRMVDLVALIALAGIAIHLALTVLSPNVTTALVLRSFQGAIIGLGFLISAAIGRPIVLYVARQFVTAGAPERRPRFEAVVAMDRAHTFLIITLVWGSMLIAMSGVHIALVLHLPHADYVLISPIIGVTVNALLSVWAVRFTVARLAAYARAIETEPGR